MAFLWRRRKDAQHAQQNIKMEGELWGSATVERRGAPHALGPRLGGIDRSATRVRVWSGHSKPPCACYPGVFICARPSLD